MQGRCIIGVGGPRSAEYPFLRAHVGRAFVEHVADTHGYRRWQPVSSALADISEHSSGLVLCRLWPVGGQGGRFADAAAVRQCLRYLGVQSSKRAIIAHGEMRRPCGQFKVVEGLAHTPFWASGVAGSLVPAQLSSKIWSLEIGVGPERKREGKSFSEASMSPKEAAAVVQGVFPAAYEWLLKQWFGPLAVTEGAVFRKRLPQDTRRGNLSVSYAGVPRGK